MLLSICKSHLASPPLHWLASALAQHYPDLAEHFSEMPQRRVLLHTGGPHAASLLCVPLQLGASQLPYIGDALSPRIVSLLTSSCNLCRIRRLHLQVLCCLVSCRRQETGEVLWVKCDMGDQRFSPP